MKQAIGQYLLKYFPPGGAARSVATLVSGTAIGQFAVVAASPVLTRLYTPGDFGVLGVYAALIGIFGAIAGLKYELAIPLPKSIVSAANLMALTLVLVVASSLTLAIFVFIFKSEISYFLNTPAIEDYLYLVPVGVFLTGIYQAFNYWAIRRKYFSTIARTSAQQGIGSAGVQIVLGWINTGSLGLMVGQIIGQSAGIIALVMGAYRNDRAQVRRLSKLRIRHMATRFIRFPKYTTWQAILNTSSTMLPLILFASLLSPAIAGLYILAHRTLSLPLSLIGKSIGQVFHSRAAEAHHKGNLDDLMLSAFQRLLQIALGPMAFVAILAPEIFGFIFGIEWRQAGYYAQWMMPWLIIQFVVSPLSVVSSVTGHQLGELVSQVMFVTVRLGALLAGTYVAADNISVELYAISGFVVYIGFLLWLIKLLNISFARIVKAIYPALPLTSAFIFLSLAVKLFHNAS